MIFSGSFWSIVILASLLEVSKLTVVSWVYRYRHLAGKSFRTYLYSATIVLGFVTSLGIFGYLTRAHVESEATVAQSQLTLREIDNREQSLRTQRTQLTTELSALTSQANQLVTQLGAAERLTGTTGAVAVQRQTSIRRDALLKELKGLDADISLVQKERIEAQSISAKTTADVGPLRYVAQVIFGRDDADAIRRSVGWLTALLMVVFDPLAVALLIAANILFLQTVQTAAGAPTRVGGSTVFPVEHTPRESASGPPQPPSPVDPNITDIPDPLIRD